MDYPASENRNGESIIQMNPRNAIIKIPLIRPQK